MLHDVYFLTGLPMLGVIGDMAPNLSHGETLEELYERHYFASAHVWVSCILMCDIDIISTRAVATMVLWILGSTGNHKVSRGKL